MPTTIKIGEETWKRLNHRKQVGDTFDDVVTRLLDEVETKAQSANK